MATTRVELALNVKNIAKATAFYEQLFGVPPHKQRDGYANFVVEDPPVKLVLFENPGAQERLNHLGIEAPTSQHVTAALARFQAAGLATRLAEHDVCCHAMQDKVFVTARMCPWAGGSTTRSPTTTPPSRPSPAGIPPRRVGWAARLGRQRGALLRLSARGAGGGQVPGGSLAATCDQRHPSWQPVERSHRRWRSAAAAAPPTVPRMARSPWGHRGRRESACSIARAARPAADGRVGPGTSCPTARPPRVAPRQLAACPQDRSSGRRGVARVRARRAAGGCTARAHPAPPTRRRRRRRPARPGVLGRRGEMFAGPGGAPVLVDDRVARDPAHPVASAVPDRRPTPGAGGSGAGSLRRGPRPAPGRRSVGARTPAAVR